MKDYDYNQFSTHDLALTAALVCSGFVIESLNKDHSGRASFYFIRENSLDQTIKKFWDSELKVEPRAYFDAIKHIKTRIYSVA